MAAPNWRGGSGRKKIVIRRIEQEDAQFVCYSKRRQGFFSKATDLAVLTGAHVAALAFSPRGRAFSFGHPSVDSVVERFLAGEAAGAGAREDGAADDRLLAGDGTAGEDEKLEKLQQEFHELRTELTELKKRTKRTDKAMAKERSAGDQIASWFDPKARDMGAVMGDKDMAAFFAALMQMKDAVSDRANQVLLEVMHAPPPPPQIFAGSTFEYGSSSGTANDGMEFQFLVPPPQEQGMEAGMDMQQMVMAPLPPSHVVAAGMNVQDMPPPPGLAAGMDLEQMQMTMPRPPGFNAGLDKEIDQWLDVMLPHPEFTAGTETVQQGLDQPNAGFPY
ncbi:agamous-like MADS-box protein AGL23 [Triticum dicoccoides]|uniref:agamous-like MADS-box protein AGL23 n=1 Tax=Triticum dicoccoides TaxID=85692 RepID=UPI00188FD7B1|nr:agamous-like MADS-box protein AGL23 [Triticum dicoccoides]